MSFPEILKIIVVTLTCLSGAYVVFFNLRNDKGKLTIRGKVAALILFISGLLTVVSQVYELIEENRKAVVTADKLNNITLQTIKLRYPLEPLTIFYIKTIPIKDDKYSNSNRLFQILKKEIIRQLESRKDYLGDSIFDILLKSNSIVSDKSVYDYRIIYLDRSFISTNKLEEYFFYDREKFLISDTTDSNNYLMIGSLEPDEGSNIFENRKEIKSSIKQKIVLKIDLKNPTKIIKKVRCDNPLLFSSRFFSSIVELSEKTISYDKISDGSEITSFSFKFFFDYIVKDESLELLDYQMDKNLENNQNYDAFRMRIFTFSDLGKHQISRKDLDLENVLKNIEIK